MAVKPEDDFQGYMEGINRAAAKAERYKAQLEAHRIWRESTWSGWAIRQIQAVGRHFAPFFEKLTELMSNDRSAGSILLVTIIRLVIISICIGAVYVLAHFIQRFVGNEYVIEEEEVVIIEDVSDEDDEESDDEKKTRSEYTNSAANRRNKKKKQ